MKILHVYKDYYPILGGIENHIKILAEAQAKNGIDVTVLATSLTKETVIENINAVKVIKAGRAITISRTPLSLSFLKFIHRMKVDVSHLHFPYPFGEFANYFLGVAKHTIITYHSDIVKQRYIMKFYKPLLKRILNKANRIIATSPQYLETSIFLKELRHKCTVIPLGIDINYFSKSDRFVSEDIRKKYKNPNLILFVGRLCYFKGLEYLIEAMQYVNGKLLIIGTGPEEQNLKAKVNKDNLNWKIIFLGNISNNDLPSYYDACDLFVLPSSHRSEAFGTVIIEAMASGKAVISTELGTGTSFVNVNGKTGIVVPPRNAKLLADAINSLLADEQLRKKYELNAKRRSEEFSSEHLVEKITNLYTEVVKEQELGVCL